MTDQPRPPTSRADRRRMPRRRRPAIAALAVAGLFAATLGVTLSTPARAQAAWPSKPIRFIVPYGTGGFSDTRSRLIGDRLSKALGQPVVIENRVGAGGVPGTDAIAKAAPDGYTIGMGALAPLAVNVSLMKKLPYDPQKDIQPIVMVETAPLILTAGPGTPAKSVAELIAEGKASPGKVTFGSSGIGGAHHLSGEMLRQRSGAEFTHVPYKGGAAAATDTMAGHVSFMFEMGYAALPSLKAGKVRALGVTSTRRLAVLPDVPTLAESGLQGFESYNWQGIVGPAGLPAPILQRLNREINAILQMPDVRDAIVGQGSQVVGGTPEQFGAFIRAETEQWGKVVREAGIKPE